MVAKTDAVIVPRSRLDAATGAAVRVFLSRLPEEYVLLDVLLFGSRARGDHRRDSDADLAVVLRGPLRNKVEIGMEMAGIAVDVLRETGILIEALPIWEDELARPEQSRNPSLVENIKREGISI